MKDSVNDFLVNTSSIKIPISRNIIVYFYPVGFGWRKISDNASEVTDDWIDGLNAILMIGGFLFILLFGISIIGNLLF